MAKRARQKNLPGTEEPSIPAIDQAAEAYYDVMMERTKLSKEQDEAKTALIEVMKENGLTLYKYDDKIITLTAKSNVKVKRRKDVEVNVNGQE